MTTLESIHQNYAGSVAASTHLLLIGHTKTGKSDYVAQAAKAGHTVIYVDNDNGLSTLMSVLADDAAARARVHYFNPKNMGEFVEDLLTMGIMRYNLSTREKFVSTTAAPDAKMVEIYPARIPKGFILAIDSWTTLAYSVMANAARAIKVELTSIDKYGREIYQPSGFKLTQLAQLLQLAPFNVIVQAHSGFYERKEKPPGTGRIKEEEMIIKETTEVPISSSMPHALTLGKYFNQIGYMVIDRFDKRVIDFKPKAGRIGGGTPNSAGDPRLTHSYVNLFGAAVAGSNDSAWMKEMTTEEFKESMKPKASAPSSVTQSTPAVAAVVAPAVMRVLPIGLKKF